MSDSCMVCRPGCGACCIGLSISAAIPGMPAGKPAGVPCIQLDPITWKCRIYTRPDRPACCRGLKCMPDLCGNSRDEALDLMAEMERLSRPE